VGRAVSLSGTTMPSSACTAARGPQRAGIPLGQGGHGGALRCTNRIEQRYEIDLGAACRNIKVPAS